MPSMYWYEYRGMGWRDGNCVCVCVCVCVRTSAAAREHSSNRVPTCGDICACENRLREHLLDQLFTVGLGPGCPWKNLAKFSETVFFTPFRLMPRVIYCLQRQSLSRRWTETRWTIGYDVTVTHPHTSQYLKHVIITFSESSREPR